MASFDETIRDKLVFLARFDETLGDAKDIVSGFSGKLTGTTTPTQGVSGIIKNSYSFNEGYVDFGNPTVLDLRSSGTISVWIYPTTLNSYHPIVDKCNTSIDVNGYSLYLNGFAGDSGSFLILELDDGSNFTQIDTDQGTILPNTWNHCVATWNTQKRKLYINGLNKRENDITYLPISNIYNLLIGKFNLQESYHFFGKIDEVALWNRDLTQDEILYLYNESYGRSIYIDKSRYINGIDGYSGEHPISDNSSIDDTLIGWKNLQVLMRKSINAGTSFSKPIVSTHSILSPAWENYYYGTVLSPNGDIHCVPNNAEFGQKINCYTGIVSTYSLAYTTENAYMGGVLDSYGYIHFVPAKASVGQKISPSGVVSTYSLAFTYGDNEAYNGGVLAPNGDIHFVKYAAWDGVGIGQKISKEGIASTYAYPSAEINIGGVLSPNGTIYLAPFGSNNMGIKINTTNDTVSTYSLVYTTTDAYSGCVLDSHGNVHFVPNNAEVGQKIDINGVVSTYSLIITGDYAYNFGVLAPNGDVHFISSNGKDSQRIDKNNIVSTYPKAYGYNIGATLTPNGDIYCISYSNFYEKVSTLPAIPFDISLCISPFFNKR